MSIRKELGIAPDCVLPRGVLCLREYPEHLWIGQKEESGKEDSLPLQIIVQPFPDQVQQLRTLSHSLQKPLELEHGEDVAVGQHWLHDVPPVLWEGRRGWWEKHIRINVFSIQRDSPTSGAYILQRKKRGEEYFVFHLVDCWKTSPFIRHLRHYVRCWEDGLQVEPCLLDVLPLVEDFLKKDQLIFPIAK